jgi:serine/threonine-protein kinase HipA
MAFASNVGVKAVRAKRAIEEVAAAVERWRAFAEEAGVEASDMSRIEKTFRMTLRRD